VARNTTRVEAASMGDVLLGACRTGHQVNNRGERVITDLVYVYAVFVAVVEVYGGGGTSEPRLTVADRWRLFLLPPGRQRGSWRVPDKHGSNRASGHPRSGAQLTVSNKITFSRLWSSFKPSCILR